MSAVNVFAVSLFAFGRTPKSALSSSSWFRRQLERAVDAGRERGAADDRSLEDDVDAVAVGERVRAEEPVRLTVEALVAGEGQRRHELVGAVLPSAS